MKILGFFFTVVVVFYLGSLYWQGQDNKGTAVPQSYRTMDTLETKGIYGEGYTFKDLDGKPVAVKDYAGKIIIFSFWATWCEPCVEEFPSLIKLLETYPDDIVLFAISHDKKPDDVRNFIDAFKGWKPNLKVLFDTDKAVSKALQVDLLPEGYIFDQEGMLVKKILGTQDWSTPGALNYFKELITVAKKSQ